jgi:hypothetical protein
MLATRIVVGSSKSYRILFQIPRPVSHHSKGERLEEMQRLTIVNGTSIVRAGMTILGEHEVAGYYGAST